MSPSLAALSHVHAGRDITIQHFQAASAAEARSAVRVVGSIPQRALGFQPRAAQATLAADRTVGRTAGPQSAWVVSGMGGVGKTQLAAAVARNLLATHAVDLLVWVPASTRAGIITSYAAAAASVGVGAEDPEQAGVRFVGWLAETCHRWAIMLDDVSVPEHLRGLWPPEHLTGTTIVTTRRRDATLLANRELIDVDVFTKVEARAYLTERLPEQLADDIDGIAADLGFLPLALSHAAAHLIDLELPCSSYREQFANRKRRLNKLFPTATALFDDSPAATVATTWSMSIEQADRNLPTGMAGPLLELASLLDPNGIPNAVFNTAAARDYRTKPADPLAQGDEPAAGIDDELDDTDIRAGLANLRRFSLVATAGSVVRVHALVQRVVRESLQHQRAGRAVHAAADALLQTWPDIERDSTFGALLRANAAALASCPEAEYLWNTDGVHPILFRMIVSLGDAGLVRAAADAADQLHLHNHERLGPDHAATLAARSHLARWRGKAGDVAGAFAANEQLLADQLRILGADHPDIFTTRREVAWWRGEAGDPAGAAEATAGLLPEALKVLGPDHPETLTIRFLVAYWQGEAGDATGAAAALEEVLADRLRVLGPDHPDTFGTRGTLAYWRGECGDPAGAATATQQLLADRLRILGPEHSRTLATRYNLAVWQGEAGDPAGAAKAFEGLLEDEMRILGPDHPDTLTTRYILALWQGEAGDPAGAATAIAEVLADVLRVLGPNHPDTLATRHGLAVWRGEAGDPAGAATALGELLSDYFRLLGPDHLDTLATRHGLAVWRGEAGDPAGAATALGELLSDCLRLLGPDHPDTVAARSTLSYWLSVTRDPAAAETTTSQRPAEMPQRPGIPGALAKPGLSHWRRRTCK
ncbi:tetratricopeptide repeat protein [Microbispora sp. NPDC049125]|uniref:tetratricopeptide repeat protein n=1 Tax=Microbispora sp. NPDC049125 TaxID=3154929 RepID=UPI00346706A4